MRPLWLDIFRPVCGIAIITFAIIGYRAFTKKNSTKGLVISIVVSLVTVVMANYLVLVMQVYEAYKIWYESGEYFTKVTFLAAIKGSYYYMSDAYVRGLVLRDLGLGVVSFCSEPFLLSLMLLNAAKTRHILDRRSLLRCPERRKALTIQNSHVRS